MSVSKTIPPSSQIFVGFDAEGNANRLDIVQNPIFEVV